MAMSFHKGSLARYRQFSRLRKGDVVFFVLDCAWWILGSWFWSWNALAPEKDNWVDDTGKTGDCGCDCSGDGKC